MINGKEEKVQYIDFCQWEKNNKDLKSNDNEMKQNTNNILKKKISKNKKKKKYNYKNYYKNNMEDINRATNNLTYFVYNLNQGYLISS